MSRVRGRDTKPEMALRRALYALGLRFRVHGELPGRPDIVFPRAKLAVFVDGAFWHGRDIERLEQQLHVRRRFWMAKIIANIERDRRNDAALRRLGYRVVRLWDHQIKKDPVRCALRILRIHRSRVGRDADKDRGAQGSRVTPFC